MAYYAALDGKVMNNISLGRNRYALGKRIYSIFLRLIQTWCVKRIRLVEFLLRRKCIQIEKILSTAFSATNYTSLKEALRMIQTGCACVWSMQLWQK